MELSEQESQSEINSEKLSPFLKEAILPAIIVAVFHALGGLALVVLLILFSIEGIGGLVFIPLVLASYFSIKSSLYLFKFCFFINEGIKTNSSKMLAAGYKNLRNYFRFLAILSLFGLALGFFELLLEPPIW